MFPADTPSFGTAALTRRRKAAMVVQLALVEECSLSLSRLPEQVQLDLTREIGALRVIDRATVDAVAEEFLSHLESIGLPATGGVEGALAALRDRISPAAAERLQAEATRGTRDPWAVLAALPSKDLVPLMQAESTEVSAVALSKLPVAKSAEVLSLLPGPLARRIAFAVSQTEAITPEAVLRIGRALALAYGDRPRPAFVHGPAQRVGAILNSSQPATRDTVLEGLNEDDPRFADGVRKAIFTFADIPARVAPADLGKIVRGVDGATLVAALAAATDRGGAEETAMKHILDNISQRLADQLREEIAERGKPRKAEGETAMAAVIGAIRAAVEQGEIKLIEPEEAED